MHFADLKGIMAEQMQDNTNFAEWRTLLSCQGQQKRMGDHQQGDWVSMLETQGNLIEVASRQGKVCGLPVEPKQ